MLNTSQGNDAQTANGVVTERSSRSVEEVVQLLEELLAKKGITLFTVVDHSAEARRVGLEMPTTKLLIFGNPKMGTPAMLAAPSSAIDLPLKILVAQAEDGAVNVSYNSAVYLENRHNIPDELAMPFTGVADLVRAVL